MSLLVSSTVALAQDPTLAPTPTPAPTVTVTAPSPAATVLATPTATATAALTPEPSATVAASPSATPAATSAPPTHVARRPQRPARQAATPTATPTATATPDPGEAGATITACHALGDGTYETVQIVLHPGVLDEHFDHEDDLIPAPATGCGPGAQPDELVGVCHATGDPERPYEFAGFFDPTNLEGHENHAGDLIPAPNGSCPGLDEYFVPTPVPSPDPTREPTTTPAPTQTATAEPTPTPTADGIDEAAGGDRSPGAGGASHRGTASTASAAYLPFTGFELWLIAAAGVGLTLMGSGLRLLSAQPAVGVTR